jgi:hypothetical protein
LSLDEYNKRIQATYDQIKTERERLAALAEQDAELTKQTIGPKGLRQRLEDEGDKRERVEREIKDFVKPQLLHMQLQADLVQRQQQQLMERLKELKQSALLER